MSTVLVAMEGVLRDDRGRSIRLGQQLVRALAGMFKVIIALDDADIERAAMWLKMEDITEHQELLPGIVPAALRGQDQRIAQVENLQGRGYVVSLVVDSVPRRIEQALYSGVPGLLFVEPKFTRPEHRPDYVEAVTPWADLVAEIEKQHYMERTLTSE